MSPVDRPRDHHDRPLRNLRVSVTDRCNLRCSYCMPEPDYDWLPRADILDFDEVQRVVTAFAELGVDHVRLTGGEPLLRKDLPDLIARITSVPGIEDVAMTTNAVRLPELAPALREAGLDRITVSLDTLRPDRFRELTKRDVFDRVLRGIRAAVDEGFAPIKINTVVMRGTNDDEIADMVAFGREHGAEVRFIEYMDVGGATRWDERVVVSRDEILERVRRVHGSVVETSSDPSAPADRFTLTDGTKFGVIASTTQPFCSTCDRARLTADGTLLTCLYARTGVDVRKLVRDPVVSDSMLRDRFAQIWRIRQDRGAERRLELASKRAPLASADELREDPHLEMHTRGG